LLKFDLFELVHHLAEQGAALHVVEGVLEHAPDDARERRVLARRRQLLQRLEEVVVDEVGELVARDALGVLRPGAPAEPRGDRALVVVFEQLLLGLVIVEHLQEDHPDELADALSVAVDARVLPHDVLDAFDGRADAHALLGPWSAFVELVF
jgi:hypothetical protein